MTGLLLDTSVAIPLRDGEPAVRSRVGGLTSPPYISILTAAELEGGVHAQPRLTAQRRAAFEAMVVGLDILPFGPAELAAYRTILGVTGFNRSKVLDRLIAATALAHGLRLATRNPKDFVDVPDLDVEPW